MTPNTLLLRDYNAGGEVDSISAAWLRSHAFGAKPLEPFRYPKIVILIGLQKHYQTSTSIHERYGYEDYRPTLI